MQTLWWWIDVSFTVHPNCHSHTGAILSIGKGTIYSMSSKQKLNTWSSKEAELVGINDAMAMILWVHHFLQAQGCWVCNNIIFQDNKSTMCLVKNGQLSSSKRTCQLDIHYYFITNVICHVEVQIQYCPTSDIITNFFTKPLPGLLFRKFRMWMPILRRLLEDTFRRPGSLDIRRLPRFDKLPLSFWVGVVQIASFYEPFLQQYS